MLLVVRDISILSARCVSRLQSPSCAFQTQFTVVLLTMAVRYFPALTLTNKYLSLKIYSANYVFGIFSKKVLWILTTTEGHSRIELYFVFLCLRIVHACFSNIFLATLFTRVIFFPESFSKNSNWPRMRSRGLLPSQCQDLFIKCFK